MIKVALLLINSIAVLNEERFLARSKPFLPSFTRASSAGCSRLAVYTTAAAGRKFCISRIRPIWLCNCTGCWNQGQTYRPHQCCQDINEKYVSSTFVMGNAQRIQTYSSAYCYQHNFHRIRAPARWLIVCIRTWYTTVDITCKLFCGITACINNRENETHKRLVNVIIIMPQSMSC
jgi:hypothetical protein